jgi:F0F1-type ATP synthase membrane subunit c/vacuolar-type H+-ATPase subunit K
VLIQVACRGAPHNSTLKRNREPVRVFIVLVGFLLSSGFVLLGVLVALMNEGRMPVRWGSAPIHGPAAYAMAVAWAALGIAIFSVGLLMAEVGPKYYIRIVRDWSFLGFGIGFITTLIMEVRTVYGNVAL